jgi:NADPH:quinone reductase-like Zn-dependent oxidoreductase
MKAVFFGKHGEADVLAYGERPDPAPKAGEVLVAVRACSLNHLDIWVRKGLPGVAIPLPHIPGCDVAGTVAALGRGVRGFKIGDRVVVSPGMGCDRCPRCRSGWDSLCDAFHILGFQIDGGYAEKVAVAARRVLKVGPRLSFEEWAAVPLVFLTAWHMLHTRACVRRGETVLVHAAGSGVGSAAIQIAKLAGARVMTTVGSDDKIGKARRLGADRVVNYRKQDFAEEAKRWTGGAGVDVVFEHVGPEVWTKSLASLAKRGRLVTCGATSGPRVELDLRFLYMRQQSVMGSYMGGARELQTVLGLVAKGRLRPVVDRIFPLKEVREAHLLMESRAHFGKIVLRVP